MSRVRTASPPTVGRVADVQSAGEATRARISPRRDKACFAILLALATAPLACQVFSVGLPTDAMLGDSADIGPSRQAHDGTSIDELLLSAPDSIAVAADAPESGKPLDVGCSDGTREGFRDMQNWPNIAGCAGGWQLAGLLSPAAREPQCMRMAGNDSPNPEGADCSASNVCVSCSASDLCAPTWHVCLDGPDVASHSPSGCEDILSPGEQGFFLVMTGASPLGVCYPGSPPPANDLHGCGGNIGQPESDQCPPLTRRMGFADCAATRGVWQCGDSDENLSEAEVVSKPSSSLGGVLCCRD